MRAVFIGKRAKNTIMKEDRGLVHSVFRNTVNVRCGEHLISIHPPGHPRSPISIITDEKWDEAPRIGTEVCMSSEMIEAGTYRIFIKDSEIWIPQTMVVSHFSPKTIEKSLSVIEERASEHSGNEGLAQIIPCISDVLSGVEPHISSPTALTEFVVPKLMAFAERAADGGDVSKSVKDLIGLGPGLTPSMDDFFSCFMVSVWWISHSFQIYPKRIEDLVLSIMENCRNTTFFSRQLLICAASGEADELTENLLRALLTGGGAMRETDCLLAVGHTSGVDTIAGVLFGARYMLNLCFSRNLFKAKCDSSYEITHSSWGQCDKAGR